MMRLKLRIVNALLILAAVLSLGGCGQSREAAVPAESKPDSAREVTPQAAEPAPETIPAASPDALPDTVFFGTYPQSADKAEPMEWIVLDRQEDRVLLLAKDCIDSLPWHNTQEGVTWDSCDLRAWLNGEFLQTAFTPEEQEAIFLSDLDNGDDLGYGTPVGANTQDQVFLLSGAEVERYLPSDEGRTVKPTEYAVSRGAYTNGDGDCAWWLRSPGMTETSPAYLSSGGSIGNRTHEVDETIIGVRPAIWVQKMTLD